MQKQGNREIVADIDQEGENEINQQDFQPFRRGPAVESGMGDRSVQRFLDRKEQNDQQHQPGPFLPPNPEENQKHNGDGEGQAYLGGSRIRDQQVVAHGQETEDGQNAPGPPAAGEQNCQGHGHGQIIELGGVIPISLKRHGFGFFALHRQSPEGALQKDLFRFVKLNDSIEPGNQSRDCQQKGIKMKVLEAESCRGDKVRHQGIEENIGQVLRVQGFAKVDRSQRGKRCGHQKQENGQPEGILGLPHSPGKGKEETDDGGDDQIPRRRRFGELVVLLDIDVEDQRDDQDRDLEKQFDVPKDLGFNGFCHF
jgi:hypothetical protein